MSSQPQHKYTLEEYFALELASEEKYEFWNGEVFCMSGASLAHNQITMNIGTEASVQLRAHGCQVLPADMRVKVPTYPPYRYPDLTALCGQPEIEQLGGLDMLLNPALIIEVLSKSTEGFDRGDKFTYYKSIASFSEYLLVAQHRPHVSQFVRQETASGRSGNSTIWPIQCVAPPSRAVLALRDVYRDVTFDPTERNGDQWERGANEQPQ
jgi:Uma2 family endonuclease